MLERYALFVERRWRDVAAAVELLRAAARLEGAAGAGAARALVAALCRHRRREAAAAAVKEAISRFPGDCEMVSELGAALAELAGRSTRGEAMLRAALSHGARPERSLLRLSRACLAAGNATGAALEAEACLRALGASPAPDAARAADGGTAAEREWLRREALRCRGEALLDAGQAEEAVPALEAAIEGGLGDARACGLGQVATFVGASVALAGALAEQWAVAAAPEDEGMSDFDGRALAARSTALVDAAAAAVAARCGGGGLLGLLGPLPVEELWLLKAAEAEALAVRARLAWRAADGNETGADEALCFWKAAAGRAIRGSCPPATAGRVAVRFSRFMRAAEAATAAEADGAGAGSSDESEVADGGRPRWHSEFSDMLDGDIGDDLSAQPGGMAAGVLRAFVTQGACAEDPAVLVELAELLCAPSRCKRAPRRAVHS